MRKLFAVLAVALAACSTTEPQTGFVQFGPKANAKVTDWLVIESVADTHEDRQVYYEGGEHAFTLPVELDTGAEWRVRGCTMSFQVSSSNTFDEPLMNPPCK